MARREERSTSMDVRFINQTFLTFSECSMCIQPSTRVFFPLSPLLLVLLRLLLMLPVCARCESQHARRCYIVDARARTCVCALYCGDYFINKGGVLVRIIRLLFAACRPTNAGPTTNANDDDDDDNTDVEDTRRTRRRNRRHAHETSTTPTKERQREKQ